MNPHHEIRERVSVRGGDLVWSRPWAAAELALAIRLRRKGWGSTAIGRKLGRTRNAVIGALYRAEEPGPLANQYGQGVWSRSEMPARPLPMRFTEQRR